MKPGVMPVPLEVMQGDTLDDFFVVIPNLATVGGPTNLTNSSVRAQIRKTQDPTSELFATFDVEIVNAVTGRVQPKLTPLQTAVIVRDGAFDLQVEDLSTGWIGTVLRGPVKLIKEVTTP